MRRIVAVLALVTMAGCATDTHVPYKIVSVPSGARIEVNGVYIGNAPMEITLGTSKHWVGLAVAPGGWGYADRRYEVVCYPPPELAARYAPEMKVVNPRFWTPGGTLYFELPRLRDPEPPRVRRI